MLVYATFIPVSITSLKKEFEIYNYILLIIFCIKKSNNKKYVIKTDKTYKKIRINKVQAEYNIIKNTKEE